MAPLTSLWPLYLFFSPYLSTVSGPALLQCPQYAHICHFLGCYLAQPWILSALLSIFFPSSPFCCLFSQSYLITLSALRKALLTGLALTFPIYWLSYSPSLLVCLWHSFWPSYSLPFDLSSLAVPWFPPGWSRSTGPETQTLKQPACPICQNHSDLFWRVLYFITYGGIQLDQHRA